VRAARWAGHHLDVLADDHEQDAGRALDDAVALTHAAGAGQAVARRQAVEHAVGLEVIDTLEHDGDRVVVVDVGLVRQLVRTAVELGDAQLSRTAGQEAGGPPAVVVADRQCRGVRQADDLDLELRRQAAEQADRGRVQGLGHAVE
jgi:hypothetical protein